MLSISDTTSTTVMAAELVDVISAFYFSEPLHFHVLIPPFLRKQSSEELWYPVALKFLLQKHPGRSQICSIGYLRRTKEKLPEKLNEDPKAATLWAKQTRKFFSGWCGEYVLAVVHSLQHTAPLWENAKPTTLCSLTEATVQLFQDRVVIWIPSP